jgi:hypothetical protein
MKRDEKIVNDMQKQIVLVVCQVYGMLDESQSCGARKLIAGDALGRGKEPAQVSS